MLKTGAAAAIGSIATCLLFVAALRFNLIHHDNEMSYSDLAALLLGVVALLVAILGAFLAIAAVWGFGTIKASAEDAAVKHVADELQKGEMGPKLEQAFFKFMETKVNSERFGRIVQKRVDTMVYGGEEDRFGYFGEPAEAAGEEEAE